MRCVRKVTEDLYWVGVNDKRLHLFENIHPIPRGVSYNSYLLMDEQTVLFDTVDWSGCREFLKNVEEVLDGRDLDYLIINHMEPDHAASMEEVLIRYPNCKVISNEKSFMFMHQFGFNVEGRKDEVKEGDIRCFGKHTITFVAAPMVHWPEAMVSFDTTNGVLFSADAFGSFGSLDGKLFNDEVNFDRDWIDDARRYFTNIVGKYGAQVQALLKKAATLDINTICPLHGPILKENLAYYIGKYNVWSSYEPEDKGILVAYASIHGNTKKAAEILAEKIKALGEEKVAIADLSREDMAECVEDAFRYDRMILCAATYDGNAFVPMEDFLHHLQIKTYQNRTVGLLENGTWAPTAANAMRKYLESMKNVTILDDVVTIKSTYKPENEVAMDKLAQAIVNA